MGTRIFEMTDIMAELNSEFIYESIMIESETDTNQNSSESKKRRTLSEKIKNIWKKFCEFVKNAVLNVKKFLRKISNSFYESTEMKVPDIESGMVKLRAFISELEKDEYGKKLSSMDIEEKRRDIIQTINAYTKTMRRREIIKLYERAIYEIEGMVKRVGKIVDKILHDLVEVDSMSVEEFEQRGRNIVNARNVIFQFLNSLIRDLQRDVNRNSRKKDESDDDK